MDWILPAHLTGRVWHLVSRLLGIETFLNFLRVSVLVSKILVSKKSRYQFWKKLVSKKSLGIGLKNIWSRKKRLGIGLKKSLSNDLKKFVLKQSRAIGLKNFGLGSGLKE